MPTPPAHPRDSWGAVKKALIYLVQMIFLALILICFCGPAFSGPLIRISFETDPAANQKLVHAQAEFPSEQAVVYDVFYGITDYAKLHPWIHKTTLVSADEVSQEYRVEFRFPWPVGRQWSLVEVWHRGNTIFWRQVAGSLKVNHGRISFASLNGKVQIDYLAAIDIGLPELWTQTYKEKFVREFMTAAYDRVEDVGLPAVLVQAARP